MKRAIQLALGAARACGFGTFLIGLTAAAGVVIGWTAPTTWGFGAAMALPTAAALMLGGGGLYLLSMVRE